MIDFVENKPIDWSAVREILEPSRRCNRWANFGPACQALERYLADYFGIRDDLCVVMASSCTVALHALVRMREHLAGRRLDWTVSSFGFACTVQGPLCHARVVDCAEDGWQRGDIREAVVQTNLFGTGCWSGGDEIRIVDSAAAFDVPHGADEVISFHQTKPWGMGEGGCAVVEARHESLYRGLLSFGDEATRRIATNGKISDFSCALILQRLWSWQPDQYRVQYRRVYEIARRLDYHLLMPISEGTPVNVPLMAPAPVWNPPSVPAATHWSWTTTAPPSPPMTSPSDQVPSRVVAAPKRAWTPFSR